MYIVIFIYGVAVFIIVAIIIFLIFKRIRDKKNETFEKRKY